MVHFFRNIEKYKSKPKYLIEKEERERDDAEFNKSEDTKRRRDRKNNFKQKDFRKDKNLSDDEANLPSLDDLGIKVEEKNNQIIFDVSRAEFDFLKISFLKMLLIITLAE